MKPPAAVQRQARRRERRVFSRRQPPAAWKQALIGLACITAGTGLIVALHHLILRLDAVLLFSESLSHLIGGFINLGLGLGPLLGLLLLLGVTVGALLLVLAGLIRIGRSLGPAVQGKAPTPGAGPAGQTTQGRERPAAGRRSPRRRP